MPDRCVYCGYEYELEKEHVIPAHWLDSRKYDDSRQWIVPACSQCNSFAGAFVAFSVPEKARFILKRYLSRFQKYIKTPLWTPEELAQIEYSLRVRIEESLLVKQLVLRRIEHLKQVCEYEESYMRPPWVEEKMKEATKDYKRLVSSLRKMRRKPKLSTPGQ